MDNIDIYALASKTTVPTLIEQQTAENPNIGKNDKRQNDKRQNDKKDKKTKRQKDAFFSYELGIMSYEL